MARKRSVKSKVKARIKRKYGKLLSTIAVVLVISFALCYYLIPPFQAWVNAFISDDEPPYRVEGDTTIVSQSDFRDLEVHFVDVGQGDCIIIKLPDYKNVLIDCGQYRASELVSYVQNVANITTFDYVLATHSDSDHIDNMDEIFEAFEVKHVFRPYVKSTNDGFTFDADFNKGSTAFESGTATYARFLNAIKNETFGASNTPATWEYFTDKSDFAGKVRIEETDEIFEYYFDFLTPTVALDDLDYTNRNDYSPIVRFSYQGFDFLLSGDAESDAEQDFAEYYKTLSGVDYDVEVMKAGHHGSGTSTSQALLDIFKPEYMVVQCGIENSYGHPHRSFLDRITGSNAPTLYRNDLHGDIVFTISTLGTVKGDIKLETPNKYDASYLYKTGDEIIELLNQSA
ncbi:MAG: MBL fold metallo-hydrolase [Clostridia bacterium]|nr:MBL fold metallo-hydrolase [Clostridia bacterium]